MENSIKTKIGADTFLFQIPILDDNYTYLLTWGSKCLCIDPGSAKEVMHVINEEKLELFSILVTHFHSDHTGGIAELKKKTECKVLGPVDDRIPELDHSVEEGEELDIGSFVIDVISTPGHTKPHIVYFFHDLDILFSGDTLFGAGCGKLFEGTPEEMWTSLQKIRQLPKETKIYCAHEYTQKNLEFALSLEKEHQGIAARLTAVKAQRERGEPTIPLVLEEELRTNPFLRADQVELKKAVGMEHSSDVNVFAKIRELKDTF